MIGSCSKSRVDEITRILDTPGNFSRGIDDLMKLASGWGKLSSVDESIDVSISLLIISVLKYHQYLPKRVLIPSGRSQNYAFSKFVVFDSFLQDVERSTTINVAEIDMECVWRLCGPLIITDKKLDDYLATVSLFSQPRNNQHWHNVDSCPYSASRLLSQQSEISVRLQGKARLWTSRWPFNQI